MSSPARPALRDATKVNTPTKPEPWSRSKLDRFAGPGSHYSASKQQSCTQQSPAQQRDKGTPNAETRWETPAERIAKGTPTKKAPSSSYASKTNRFDLPGGVYAKPRTPAPGEYEPKQNESVRGGVVRIQKAIRRRQSRGIFSQQEALAREVPCATKYASVPETVVEAREDAAFKSSEARFEGKGSIYDKGETPSIGQYDPQEVGAASKLGAGAQLGKSKGERFEGPSSIYTGTATPSAGEYETAVSMGSALDKASSTFKAATSRFEGPDSVYATTAAPPPGKYDVADTTTTSQAPSSSYVSTTNRFALPDSLYTKASTPAPGEYEPKHDESVKGGSVIMHEDKRKRQSRGIFSQQEALAREVPCATKYASVPETVVEAREDAAFKSSEARFEGKGSIYDKGETPSIGQYDPQEVGAATKLGAGAQLGKSKGERFEGPSSIYGAAASPTVKSALKAISAIKALNIGKTDSAASLGAQATSMAPTSVAQEDVATSEAAHSEGEQLFQRLQRLSSAGVVDREDYFDSKSGWDLKGLESDLTLSEAPDGKTSDEPSVSA